MKFQGINPKRRRLADEAYDQLIEGITNGSIGPDDNLIQEKLAEEMQISRTPVREALLRLEQEGVLTVSRRGTFRLYQMSEKEVYELYQCRAAVEGQAARILAVNGTKQEFKALRDVIQTEESISEASVPAYFKANRSIHRAFVEMADNRFLLETFDNIWGRAVAVRLFAEIEKIDLSQSLGDHMTLVDVIESGDKTAALEVFTDHIQDGYDLQIRALRT